MDTALLLSTMLFLLFLASAVASLKLMASLKRRDAEIAHEKAISARRLYETAVAKEIGERIGYSLDVEEILEVITGSLRQFIDYTSVSHVVLHPEKLKFYIHLDRSIDHSYFLEVRKNIMASLNAVSGLSYEKMQVDEIVSGAIEIDAGPQKVGSFFNIPLVISGKLSAILNISSIETGRYKEEDMTILYKIVNQASEAVSRLQEVVKTEQGKLNSMVESMGEGVLMVDKDYRIIVANPAVKEIIGISAQKEITIFDFIDSLGGKFDIRGRLEESVVKNTSYLSDRIEIRKLFFAVGVYPVSRTLPSGSVEMLGGVVVFHDVSRDVEIEKVRDEYTSMIVHELRSPLDGIKKIMELLSGGKVDRGTKEFDEYLSMTLQSSGSMLELVNDILDISKIKAGKFEIHRENSSLREVLENRVNFYKPSAAARKIDLKLSVSHNVPDMLKFDVRAIKQVINNYVSNALKFTGENGTVLMSAFVFSKDKGIPADIESGTVKVFPKVSDLKAETDSLCIVVADTGSGVPSEFMGNLFQSYVQANNQSVIAEKEKGTGLGLAITKGIAVAHGGYVGAISREEEGSSFFFTLPLEVLK